MRKIRRSIIKISPLIFCLLILVLLFYASREIAEDKLQTSLIIERSIRSAINQGPCWHPHLPIDNPEIMKFYQNVDKIDCGNSLEDWVTCEKSICYVKPQISAKHGDVTCSYTDLIRKTDIRVKYGKTTKTKEPYILQESDFVKAVCSSAQSGQSWSGMAFGIRELAPSFSHKKQIVPIYNDLESLKSLLSEESEPPFNVLMYGFDSLSRNAFLRTLPKTFKYLKDELGSIVLQGYNILGDGTTMALIPLLTGYTELELPETRKRMRNSFNVDVYPFIWQDYARQGYVTSFNEDVPHIGTFTYRLNGFAVQPTDHYLRTYYVESRNMWNSNKAHCIGHQPDHVVMLDYTKQFMATHSDTPRFVFSFHGGLSHDSISLISVADDDVVSWLTALKDRKLLDNTVLIFMADHGNRFDKIRATLQGKQEERLPFFSFAFPPSFQRRFPQEYAQFVENAERLTTAYDVHATLKDLLRLQSLKKNQNNENNVNVETPSSTPNPFLAIPISKQMKERAISLFDVIPKNRSCADAYIEPHWCACLRWHEIQTNDTNYTGIVLRLADNIVQTINTATSNYRSLCAPLELQKINWVMRLVPHQGVLQFKGTEDKDGFIPDLSDSTPVLEEIYQLQIVTNPGESLFEASVTYDLRTLTISTQLSEISRVNKYGAQAICIHDRNPDLRKYCYCRA